MSKLVPIGLGAAAVIAVLFLGSQFIGSPTSNVGGPASQPPASAAPSEAPASAAMTPTPPPLTQSFTSPLHGISMSYPEGWTTKAATEPWTDMSAPNSSKSVFDFLWHPIREDGLFLSMASQPIGDATPEDWMAAALGSVEGCTAAEPIEVDGAAGLIVGEGQGEGEGCPVDLAVVALDGRGYWIELYGNDPEFAAYDGAWFEEVLATVQLHPEDAVGGATPTPIGGTVEFHVDGLPATTVVTATADGTSVSGTAVTTFASGSHTTRVECATRDGNRWAFGGTTEQTTVPGERAGDWSAVIIEDGSPQQIGILLSIAKEAGEDCDAFFDSLADNDVSSPVESGALVPPPDLAP